MFSAHKIINVVCPIVIMYVFWSYLIKLRNAIKFHMKMLIICFLQDLFLNLLKATLFSLYYLLYIYSHLNRSLVGLFFMRKVIKYIRQNDHFLKIDSCVFFIRQIRISIQLLTLWIVMQNETCTIAFLKDATSLLHHSPILCIVPRGRIKQLKRPFEPQRFCSTEEEHKTIQRMLEGTSRYCLVILPFLSQAIMSGASLKVAQY